jgi:PAS domain S-box-containing protein
VRSLSDLARATLEIVLVLALAAAAASLAAPAPGSGQLERVVLVLVAAPLLVWRAARRSPRAGRFGAAVAADPEPPAPELTAARAPGTRRRRPLIALAGGDTAELIDTAVRHQAAVEQAAAMAVTTALARAGDVSEAAEAVNDALERSTGVARSAVLLFDEGGVCRFVGWRGLGSDFRAAVEGHCPWAEDAREAEPIVVDDVRADEALAPYREPLERERIGALAFVPVLAKTGVVGELVLYGAKRGSISAASVRAARVVAFSLGTAVTRLRMADALVRSESRLRAMIDTAMDAVISMDAHGYVIGWNAQAEATFGWTCDEALGRPLHALVIPADQRDTYLRGLARYLDAGSGPVVGRRTEMAALRKDGTRITVELAITPVTTAAGLVFSGFLRDITAAKRAADELVKARAAAEAANRAKSEFLANMSHEIRTPLTAILGYTELLRDDGDLARAPERRVQTIRTIQGAGRHLLTIINDILDISKIEAGKMTVETVETPLLGILQEVESLLRPRAREKGLELETRLASALPERILCDPTRLRQILMNLAGNAVKFTDSGRITVTARSEDPLEGGAPRLVILVDDTGPGLTLAQAARIFSSFGQGDASVTRRHGGSGLGLAISQRLAQLLGGGVSIERTAPGEGACFRLELPLVAAASAAPVARLDAVPAALPAASPPAPLAGRILLAEDGRDNQAIIAYFLRKAGAEVDLALNGRIALEMLARAEDEGRPYDLLLTDMQMPEMDGYTLAGELRARGARLPILALTAHAMAEDRQKCLDAGCDDYAVKPVDRARLLELCAEWLRRAAVGELRRG